MGQIADDMVAGACCETCGIYFKKEHGHPVTCNDCWKNLTQAQRKNVVRAYHKEL